MDGGLVHGDIGEQGVLTLMFEPSTSDLKASWWTELSTARKLADLSGSELSAAQVRNLLIFADRNSAQRRSETC